jgi:YVTN family beta-propeller protein
VTATVAVGTNPFGVAVHPDGSRVYVANVGSSTVSVIDTATNTVIATVVVGFAPEEYLHLIEKSGFPKVVTLSDAKDNKKTKKINARSGPGAFGNAYGVVGKAEEGSYTALSNVPGATPDPTCNSGWYQIQHANNDCSVIGNCFAPNDASTKSSVPEAWVCGDFVQE